MSRRRRRLIYVAAICLAVGVGIWIAATTFWGPNGARRDGIRKLSAALSPAQLEVGPLGVLLPLRNGSWIAIYYDDSHMFFTWSQAVALDSDGNWYESQVHYCGSLPIAGNLEILRKVVENASEPQQPDDSGYRNFHLLTIREAANLAVACEHLLAIGFQPVDESTRPRLRGPVAVDK